MKKIWIIAPFTEINTLTNRDRFQYIANILSKEYKVCLFTSDFIHLEKKYCNQEVKNKYSYDVCLIHEIGYKKNISIKRAISHITFAFNLKKQIEKKEKPDLIYCAYPTMTASFFAGKFAKKYSIPFVLDIQDTWPESVSSGINTDNFFIKMLLLPFTFFANTIYKMSDMTIGVSETYMNRGRVDNKVKEYHTIYIGAEGNKFDISKFKKINKLENEVWIIYIGTLSHSYDIMTAIEAFNLLKNNPNIKLYILGVGPEMTDLKNKAQEYNLLEKTIFFKGLLPYEEMINYLKNSDIALNAIKGKALQTITNKFGDYVSAGLPLLNSCQSEEVVNLIEKLSLGANYIPEDANSLKNKILEMIDNKEKLKEYSKNCINFAKNKFDRNVSYKIISEKIKLMIFQKGK